MHVRCPHCHNAIEIVGEQELSDVTCPSCGSDFNLVPETESYTPATHSIGHFQLLEQLGTGGFGTVWKAKDTQLDRLVAVKIPRSGQVDPENVEMFLREARAAAQLKHPQIVAVHEVGREDGTLYIVSDFIHGVTLADRLTAGPFTPREAAELCAQIADALHHAHEAGVIHRDLKPQNIMLDAAEQPHIMDFGLAKREAGEITMTVDGKILGTAAYMSPEQARGESHRVDRRTDVYSLGVILFELLTGERPFRGNVRMLLHQVIHDEPPSPRKLNSRVSRDLETITLKCLEKDQRQRYGTAAEVSAELHRHLSGHPIVARPLTRFHRALRWTQRNTVVAGLTAAVLLALVLGTTVSTIFGINANNRAVAEAKQRKRANYEAERATKSATTAMSESKRAFRSYYISHLNLAQRDWEAGDVRNVLNRLEATKPEHTGSDDLRGFEWYYLYRQSHSGLLTLRGDVGEVRSVAFNSVATHILTGNSDNTARVWNAKTGRELLTLRGHTGIVWSAAFNHDATRIVTGSGDKSVKLWDASTGRLLHTMTGHLGPVMAVAFSPDAARAVSGSSDRSVHVWDVVEGREIASLQAVGPISSVAFSPDGNRLVAGTRNSLHIWNTSIWTEVQTITGHEGLVTSVVWSNDGTRIVSGGFDNTVKVWDPDSGRKQIQTSASPWAVLSVAINRTGTRIASGSVDGVVRIWDANTGQPMHDFRGHTASVTSVTFEPNGTLLASGSRDGCIKIWDATSMQECTQLTGHAGFEVSMEFSKDGTMFVTAGGDGNMKVYDSQSAREIIAIQSNGSAVTDIAIDSGRTRIIAARRDMSLGLWDAASGSFLRTIGSHAPLAALPLSYYSLPIMAIAISPDGNRVASGGLSDKVLKVWDVVTCQEVASVEIPTSIASMAFNHDGTRIAVGSKENLHICDTNTWTELKRIAGHKGFVTGVVWSLDGSRIVTTSLEESTARVWDVTEGKELFALQGHSAPIKQVSPNLYTTRIVTGSQDRTVKVWDSLSGSELLTLKGHTGPTSVALNLAGTRLVSGTSSGAGGTSRLWNATPAQ